MGVRQSFERVTNRVYDRMRDPAAFRIRPEDASVGSFEPLRGRKYLVLVTFRRNGEPVPSPVWFGLDDSGRAYIQTGPETGKVKRIRHDASVVLAPSNSRGRPSGPALKGAARLVPEQDWPRAEAAIAGSYGLGRKLYEAILVGPKAPAAYIEITPEVAAS